jgi:hypothetical protein
MDPTKQFLDGSVPICVSGVTLHIIVCASTLAKSTFDHSHVDSALDGGRTSVALNSSSFALITVDSFDGKRGSSVVESPVTYPKSQMKVIVN